MAKRYYGLDIGGELAEVSEGSSTTSKGVEISFDITAGVTRQEVLNAIENIKNAIIQDIYPPA